MSKPTIHIRKATPPDIKIIAQFNAAMALETEDISLDLNILTPGVQALFDDPEKGFYIVSEIDNAVVACLMITYEWSDWRNGLFWWIQSVYVDQPFRGMGIFKEMYLYVEGKVKTTNNIAGLRLYVDKANTNARSVYKKLGMTQTNYLLYEALNN